ncbi:MAG: P-loop NTPase [Oscillospiraceae bacterium]|nr:P-loop NTPase [Oscillospiraceae bacterium]
MAQIILVASGKGGSGKSSFVTGVSSALAAMGKKVLAVDCDIGLRSLDILFGVTEKIVFDWGDLILDRCTREQAVIKGRADLLAAPRSFCDELTPEASEKLFKSFSEDYDYIFLDSPAGIDRGFQIAAAGADRAIVVSTPDSVCVRSCSRAFDELRRLGIEDVRLIVNMFEVKPVCKRKLLNIDQCIDETGVQLLGIVPRDIAVGYSSVTGTAPGEFSPSTLAYSRIAKRITGKRVPLVCE